jgi:hypothetical protein
MTEAVVVLVVGTVIAITGFVIAASPVRGSKALGVGALAIASTCLVASALMPDPSPGGGGPEDIPRAIVGLVGLVHFFLAVGLLGVSGFNRRRADRRGSG